MKKFLLSMLTCCVCAGAWAQTQGTLNVPQVNRSEKNGGPANQAIIVKKSDSREGVVKIQLANNANYRDMQFDLTLPDGISLVNTAGDPVVKVDAINDEHHVLFYALDGDGQTVNQTVKIAVVDNVVNLPANTESASKEDYGKYLLEGNDGIVFELPIQAAADFTDVKNATIANLAFTDDAATADIPGADATFGIAMIQLGDINDNGEVEIGDATCVINKIVNKNNDVYIEEVADVNGEEGPGEIGDATVIVNMVVGTASAKAVVSEEVDSLPDPE